MTHDAPSPAGRDAPPLDEATLHALVDGRLPPEAAAALEARLAGDPATADTVQAWRRQREALRSLHAALEEDAVPPALLAAAEQASRRQRHARQWWQRGALAASVLVAFGAGWLGHGAWRGTGGPAADPLAQRFAHQAAVAHAVYQPEQRHPVEVPAAQQEHLVQWLSKRLGRPLQVPDLHAQGYELVGGRLLPGDDGARAQFMFQDAAGGRVTLYIGAVRGEAPAAGETAFRFQADGPAPSFYWVDRGFGYALSGQLARARLLDLATQVYRQLEARPAG